MPGSPTGALEKPRRPPPESGFLASTLTAERRLRPAPSFIGAFAVQASEATRANALPRGPGVRRSPTWRQYPLLRQSGGFAREIIVRKHVADHIRTTCWLFAILEYDARNPAAAKQTGFLQRISADAGAMRVSDHRHSTRDRVWAIPREKAQPTACPP